MANFDDRSRELEEIRNECEQARTFARDQYATETYHCASEEHAITVDVFAQYLFEQRDFYDDIAKYFSSKIPEIEERLTSDEFIPLFGYDLTKHCSKRMDTLIAYPIEICVRLLDNHLSEEGLFRLASSQIKQKKFVAQLNLQSIDKGTSLSELSYDAHVPANTLKQYLRQLPDCLLTNALFTQWNQAATIRYITFSALALSLFLTCFSHSSEQARLQRIGQLIHQLPRIHYENLAFVLFLWSALSGGRTTLLLSSLLVI